HVAGRGAGNHPPRRPMVHRRAAAKSQGNSSVAPDMGKVHATRRPKVNSWILMERPPCRAAAMPLRFAAEQLAQTGPVCRERLHRCGKMILLGSLALLTLASAAEPAMIPVGLDAYRQWARWPYQRIGARAYMRSTYDRRGGN